MGDILGACLNFKYFLGVLEIPDNFFGGGGGGWGWGVNGRC